MNFDDAIKTHSDWKMVLQGYLRKPDKSLDAKTVGLDNKCALGQWIYGEGHEHAALPEYDTLKREHAKFHKAAADVIARADSGQNVTEEVTIGSSSAFGKASTAVIRAIMEMRRKG